MSFRLFSMLFLFLCAHSFIKVWGQEEGLASYYHSRFHGRKTASGQKYNKFELVAAHRTYPFGTYLRVTNLKNRHSVVVKVIDRGPFHRKRIIDVSDAAAEELGLKKHGLERVLIEEVPGPIDYRWLLEPLFIKEIPQLIPNDTVQPPYRMKINKIEYKYGKDIIGRR